MHAKHDPIKMVALKLTTLNWIDRVWLLSQLTSDSRLKIRSAYKVLKKIRLENPKELLAQLTTADQKVKVNETSDEIHEYLNSVETGETLVTPRVRMMLEEHWPALNNSSSSDIKDGRSC